jgi:hypothetical protein
MAHLDFPPTATAPRGWWHGRSRARRPLATSLAGAFAVVALAGCVPGGPARSSTGRGNSATETSAVAKDTSGEASLVTAVRKALLAKREVHVVVKGYQKGTRAAVESVVWDSGTTSADESIAEAKAVATIRVTSKAAYFSGNSTGLTKIIGLSSAQTKKVGSHWVELKAGTSQYKGFAGATTISSLPAGILPASGSSVKLTSATLGRSRVDVLSWKVTASGSSEELGERLIVLAEAPPLPVSETTTGGGDKRTVTFTNWGRRFTVAAPRPASVIQYSQVSS